MGNECYAFLEIVEKFQSGITGLIGFTGVIITLIVNARISRKRAEEARENERKLICSALKGELKSHLSSVEHNISEILPEQNRGSVMCFPRIETPIFDANISKIGYFSEDTISDVLMAFLTLKEMDRSLTLYSEDSNDLFHHIPVEQTNAILEILLGLIPTLNTAISSIDRHS